MAITKCLIGRGAPPPWPGPPPNGRVLRTLRDAGPEGRSGKVALANWQTAARELMMAAERGGILMPGRDRNAPSARRLTAARTGPASACDSPWGARTPLSD